MQTLTQKCIRALLITYHLLAFPTIAAVILAATCAFLPVRHLITTPYHVIAIVPVLYVSWVILTLCVGAANMQLARRLGWSKPKRIVSDGIGDDQTKAAMIVSALMMRTMMFWEIPGIRYLLRVPLFDKLVLYSWSTHVSIGRDCQIWGLIYDPDLTEVGEGAIIGGNATLTAHTLSTEPDGRFVYATAPIQVGPRAVVGGESRVALGATIGADSIVESGSNVAPYTTIPAGEIWGGNPAVFRRRRFDDEETQPHAPASAETDSGSQTEQMPATYRPSATSKSPRAETAPRVSNNASPQHAKQRDDDGVEDIIVTVREIVADAIDVPVNDIGTDARADDFGTWDSLGQMAIAAGLSNRCGVSLDADTMFRLRSISDIVGILKDSDVSHSPQSADCTADELGALPEDPELLPLLETATATRLLAQAAATDNVPIVHRPRIVVAATFTAEQIGPALTLWCRAFGIDPAMEFAGFDQVQASLLAPDSPFRTNDGFNIVLVNPEGLLSSGGANAADRVDELLDAVAQCAAGSQGRLLVSTLPPAVTDLDVVDASQAAGIRSRWNSRLAELANIEILDLSSAVERLGIAAARSESMELQARAPYSLDLFREVAKEAARVIRKHFRPAAKVLAVDADNTLWGGVVAEDGVSGIQISPDHPGRAFQRFQEVILKLKQRGVILVLVSRNEPDDVWEVFETHPGMVLSRSDFTSSRINWNPKSDNLRELAEELNLGLDSFVFADDDPAVRSEVSFNSPEVTVVPLSADPAGYTRALTRLWRFDSATGLTAEDRRRTEMMHQEQQREQSRRAHGDMHDYLRQLELRVEIRPASEIDLPRVAQLEQKTNQFNLALRRRNLEDLKQLSRDQEILVVQSSDRFGDFGTIGVFVVTPVTGDTSGYNLDTLIMSCRALGRGIEQAVLSVICRGIEQKRGETLNAVYVPGPRNQPVLKFLTDAGFADQGENQLLLDISKAPQIPAHIKLISPI